MPSVSSTYHLQLFVVWFVAIKPVERYFVFLLRRISRGCDWKGGVESSGSVSWCYIICNIQASKWEGGSERTKGSDGSDGSDGSPGSEGSQSMAEDCECDAEGSRESQSIAKPCDRDVMEYVLQEWEEYGSGGWVGWKRWKC